jgi:hypothetical protein
LLEKPARVALAIVERRAFAALLRDMKGLVEQVDEDQ